MNTKSASRICLFIVIIFASSILLAQTANQDKPVSSGNKNKFTNNRGHNSIVSNPSDISYNKKNDFDTERNKTNKRNRDTNRRDNDKRDNRNITKSENYFHIDKSGKALWDGKHWDINEYPLKVFIKESNSSYYNSDYKSYVEYAFKIWQKADERISYSFTNNKRDADIQFIFVEDLGKKYEENYLGLTEYDKNRNNEIEFSKVQISLLKFSDEEISAGEIKATIIHELGHALGLGHSDNESDIMYPYISSSHSPKMTYDELTRGDKEAIKDVIDLGDNEMYVWK